MRRSCALSSAPANPEHEACYHCAGAASRVVNIPVGEPLASFQPGLTAIGFGAVAAARLVSKLDLLRIQPSEPTVHHYFTHDLGESDGRMVWQSRHYLELPNRLDVSGIIYKRLPPGLRWESHWFGVSLSQSQSYLRVRPVLKRIRKSSSPDERLDRS